ncbi:CPBP family intramembrane glutamic endopeptidase [Neosynechococcus sphagnicola]|uniref:CPBP family intramembrane glutamic endopeptidase n=1 Tax=Neosynechococcus sphagnicola TaxID=1501145 RepID=UPI00068ECCD6|nr:CPBP family intramembrane glutamic endopeptidase [Neosynechococcus sphagnicola]
MELSAVVKDPGLQVYHYYSLLPEVGNKVITSITYYRLLGTIANTKEFLTFLPGEQYQLSLSGLQEPASKAIANLDLSPTLEFLGASFNVGDREDKKTSYKKLYHSLVASEPEPIQRMVLGFVYTRSRNLLFPILIHGLWNSGTLLTLFILGSGTHPG